MKLSQLLNIEKYDIEVNSRNICLHFLGGEQISYKPNIEYVDNKYLGLEVVETSKAGMDYLIGLDDCSNPNKESKESFTKVRDLLCSIDSLVIFYYSNYKGYFESREFSNTRLFSGTVEDALTSSDKCIKDYLDVPVNKVRLYTTKLHESMYLVIDVKRVLQ